MKGSNHTQGSLRRGREEVVRRVQQALCLPTKKEAELVLSAVVSCLECTLLDNLNAEGFTIKLGSFGKFSIRHRPAILRKIPFTGEVKQIDAKRKVKFVSLGSLRQRETTGGAA